MFVAVQVEECWISLDGRNGLAVVEAVCEADYDLAGFYRDKGFTVVETEQGRAVPLTPFWPYNCVGLVRAILAIDAPWVITPWQLYKHLTRRAARSTKETVTC